MLKSLIVSAITAASLASLATPAVGLTATGVPSTAAESIEAMCLKMRDKWIFDMRETGNDNEFIRTSMEELKCSYWGIDPPKRVPSFPGTIPLPGPVVPPGFVVPGPVLQPTPALPPLDSWCQGIIGMWESGIPTFGSGPKRRERFNRMLRNGRCGVRL